MADEAQAGASVRVTVKETFRAEFRTGFLLTHRPPVHRAHSLRVKVPILLSRVSQAVNSLGFIVESSFTSLDASVCP